MATLATDTFTRSNQSAWGTASDGTHTWSNTQGTTSWAISSNEGVYGTTSTATFLLGSGTQLNTEVLCRINMSASSAWSGPLIRAGSTGNTGYTCYCSGGTGIIAYLNSSSSATQFTTGGTVPSSGLVWIRFNVTGSSSPVLKLRAWQSGNAEPGTWTLTYTDSANKFTSAGLYGMWAFPTSATFDYVNSYSVNDTLTAIKRQLADGYGGTFS